MLVFRGFLKSQKPELCSGRKLGSSISEGYVHCKPKHTHYTYAHTHYTQAKTHYTQAKTHYTQANTVD